MYHEVRCIYNLTLFQINKTTSASTPTSMTPLLALRVGLLSVDNPLIFILPNSEYGFMLSLTLKFILSLQFGKTLFQLLFTILSIYILYLAITPIASILCILLFQHWYHCCTQHSHQWLQILLIILSKCFSESRAAIS